MGRNNQRDQHRKNRKEVKIQKSRGQFKKLSNKNFAPPDLSMFKKKIVQSLKNKTSQIHQKTVDNLSLIKKLELNHFLEDKQYNPNNDFQAQVDGTQQINKDPYLETHKYFNLMKKVIENCDILLEILDARDPLACRCKNIQRKIQSMPDKKIIIILNKIDLIPMQNAYAWQTYLRRQFPVVMFKANLQNQNSNLSSVNVYKKSISQGRQLADTMIQSSKAVGADHLVQLIKQLSKVEGSRRAVTVGVIGYPNVGKSSVINSLKRSKTCQVSSIPGCTKNLKQIKLDSQVKLLDCPGVIFQKQLTRNQMILQNTTRADDDLEEVITAILQRIPNQQIIETYQLQPFTSTIDFLAKICRKFGKLGKGGVPEIKQGAKHVIEDWNRGKLKYFTIPPFIQQRQRQLEMLKESVIKIGQLNSMQAQ